MVYKKLLLEIGTEEIPARFMPWALNRLKELFEEYFSSYRIDFGDVKTYGTPRRLVVLVEDVAEKQKDTVEEIKGPPRERAYDKNGNPTAAAIGFAKSKGVQIEDLVIKKTDQGEYVFAVKEHPGKETKEVLKEVLPLIIRKLVFPKNMYWNWQNLRFSRPIRWILCLIDDEVLEFNLEGLKSGRITRGHRFMGKKQIEIENPDDYFKKMEENFVIVDPDERKQKMISQIRSIEHEIGGKAELEEDLVEENVFLVEYPVVFYGSFSKEYLQLPKEVLVTSMKTHQRYFPVFDNEGKLMPYFIAVSNNRATNMAVVREGNERVLRARLEDANFFFKEDLKLNLRDLVEGLKNVVFQEKLGSMYDKVIRIKHISAFIADLLNVDDETKKFIEETAFLCKADLLTNMVYEFPELQGIMGREYALRQGEPKEVAIGIYEHYLPRFSGDQLPSSLVGAIVGIADRIDTVVGCFKVGLIPTGSQDPYALRRHVRSINEICWKLGLSLDYKDILRKASSLLDADEEVQNTVLDFIKQRMFNQLREKGFDYKVVNCVLASEDWSCPKSSFDKVEVISKLLQEDEKFNDFIMSAIRVLNITKKFNQKPLINESLLTEKEEKELYRLLQEKKQQLLDFISKGEYEAFFKSAYDFIEPINNFFDNVLVMDENEAIRINRLSLLASLREIFNKVGDLSELG